MLDILNKSGSNAPGANNPRAEFLIVNRRFRHSRVAALVAQRVADEKNICAPSGSEMAQHIDCKTDNIFV